MALSKDVDYTQIILKKTTKKQLGEMCYSLGLTVSTVCRLTIEKALADGSLQEMINDPEIQEYCYSTVGKRKRRRYVKRNYTAKSRKQNS